MVLGSLAAVVFAGLRSIPIAFAGGLLLGVVQNLIAGYNDSILPGFLARLSGFKAAVPFLLVLVLLLVFGRDRSRRAGSIADDAPRSDHRHGMSALRRRLPWVVFTVLLVAFSLQWFSPGWAHADTYDQTVIAQSLAMAIIFLSFVVVTGFGGMISLAQASFVTAGGFAAGWALTWDLGIDIPGIAKHGHLNFFWAVVLGVIVAAALGALVAIPMTKLGGVSLALGTLAFAFVCSQVIFSIDSVRNSEAGWAIRQPTVGIIGLNWLNNFLVHTLSTNSAVTRLPQLDFSQLPEQILLFLVVFGLVTLVIHAFQRSASGRAILATRSSEVAAQASGVRVNRTKILVFAFSAGIAGLGGVMLGLFSFGVSNSTAPPLVGLFWLALAVLFGIRRPGGALLAGFAFAASPAMSHWIADVLPGGDAKTLITSVYFVPMLSGLGAIQLAQEPDGILAFAGQQKLRKRRAKERAAQVEAAEADRRDDRVPEGTPHPAPLTTVELPAEVRIAPTGNGSGESAADAATLSLRGIVAGYGDVEVVHGVDLELHSGKVVALLGANGAGKSTLCSVAAGIVEPTFGSVNLHGRDITRAPSFRRARDGMVLVPEARGIFPGLTVEENLSIVLRDEERRAKAFERFPILEQRRKQVAGLLSGGEQQMLSLAPALADPPTVLIADEPTLGLAPLAAEAVMEAIVELRSRGSAVLLVEEHARNALRVADTLAFMELGKIVWTGPREQADMELLASAYLGGDH